VSFVGHDRLGLVGRDKLVVLDLVHYISIQSAVETAIIFLNLTLNSNSRVFLLGLLSIRVISRLEPLPLMTRERGFRVHVRDSLIRRLTNVNEA
jgi:hypothetical protein